MLCRLLPVLAVLVAWSSFAAAEAGPPVYKLKARHVIGGEGGWDYLSVDPAANRLYIARGQRVQVVDPDSGHVVGEIADTAGVHGVALDAELGKGYTSNGRGNSVTVFDIATLKTLSVIALTGAENPDFIALDPSTQRVLAFNGRSHNASVIDARSDRQLGNVPLSGKPEAAVADGRGHLFVDIEDKNELVRIDTAAAKVDATWPLPGCDEPAGLAIDPVAHRLFVGCHNRTLLVINAEDGAVVAKLPIGEGVDANAYDPKTRLVFSSQGDGTMSVISAAPGDKYSVAQTVATQSGARTMALNPVNHEVYLVSAEFDTQPPAEGQTRPRRVMKPGSFVLLVYAAKL
jgi:DNA-binding beta-propeller fold protein YncE